MAKLELNNLTKKFAPNVIPVNQVSLAVNDGEFLSLLGPSGCGKSTLLRLISGLEIPTAGEVLLGGNNLNSVFPGDRNMAMVFQSYALYPHMNVADNIATALKLRKIPPAQIEAKIQSVAHSLGLEHLLQRKPAKLSGGQRQRVALARALVREPEVFLLDEPLSNLDALLREQVRAELKQLFATQNKPVVYVTHDQTEAMTLSHKIAVLYQGKVQQLDSPSEIYHRPANQFVAGFVGSPQMNLLTLNCQNNQAILGNYQLNLPAEAHNFPQILCGIRPEHIRLPEVTEQPTVKGKIVLVEDLGREKLVTVKIPNTPYNIRALLSSYSPLVGEEIALVLPSDLLHWFALETGERI